jgi:hypothetical protein
MDNNAEEADDMAVIYDRTVRGTNGDVVQGATVLVQTADGVDDLDLYSDAALTNPIANPVASDANGRVKFYADPAGPIKLTTTGPGGAVVQDNVVLNEFVTDRIIDEVEDDGASIGVNGVYDLITDYDTFVDKLVTFAGGGNTIHIPPVDGVDDRFRPGTSIILNNKTGGTSNTITFAAGTIRNLVGDLDTSMPLNIGGAYKFVYLGSDRWFMERHDSQNYAVTAVFGSLVSKTFTPGATSVVVYNKSPGPTNPKGRDVLGLEYSNSTGVFSPRNDGNYGFAAGLTFNTSVVWAAGDYVELFLYENGEKRIRLDRWVCQAGLSGTEVTVSGYGALALDVVDEADIRVTVSNAAGTVTTSSTWQENVLNINHLR